MHLPRKQLYDKAKQTNNSMINTLGYNAKHCKVSLGLKDWHPKCGMTWLIMVLLVAHGPLVTNG